MAFKGSTPNYGLPLAEAGDQMSFLGDSSVWNTLVTKLDTTLKEISDSSGGGATELLTAMGVTDTATATTAKNNIAAVPNKMDLEPTVDQFLVEGTS